MSTKLNKQFEKLYQENHAKVYGLALGLTGDTNEAEEITQESFFRAFRSFGTFRGDCSFFTWIYRITLNVANTYLKYKNKMPVNTLTEDLGYSLEQILDMNPDKNPENEFFAKEARFKCLHCMTKCLPKDQRIIFCLAITIGLPHKIIAEILECSLSKVKTTLHRAKQRWFGYMNDRCSFIKKTNPCHCNQWIRFGKAQGWISKDTKFPSHPEINMEKKEIKEIINLRSIYNDLYQNKMDDSLVKRIKEGIQNKEWSIITQ